MKFIALQLTLFLLSFQLLSQVKDTPPVEHETTSPQQNNIPQPGFDRSNIYYGGYLNVSLGSYTVIGVAPMVGYKLTPKFSVGSQLSYEYVKNKRYATDYETSNYGMSIFTRYRIVPELYLHTEFSEMNYKLYNNTGGSRREWVPFLFLGGGYSQPITRNTWLTAQVLFDVINDKNSPYKDWEPYYSVGIGVGF